MSKNKNEIFSSFKPQLKGPTKQQEETIEYAKKLGNKMIEDKKKARQDFMLRLLANAKAINEAREDWEEKEEKEEKD